MKTQHLLERLDEIGRSLEESQHALALIGLGSVGMELSRLDEYSDLDFFAITEAGHKKRYIDDLVWLERICPIAYSFRNTEDGYKLLFTDGIFCEFAVFEKDELVKLSIVGGRVVWQRQDFPVINLNQTPHHTPPVQHDVDWLVGEAVTNLYVGLAREKRGEHLSAMRFIQWYAVDRLIELTDQIEKPESVALDLFSPDRRFEQRYPKTAPESQKWAQGINRNKESALEILRFLEAHFEVNSAIAEDIRRYCSN